MTDKRMCDGGTERNFNRAGSSVSDLTHVRRVLPDADGTDRHVHTSLALHFVLM
jgi:hypothetical protein